ncbi:MAG: glycosyltransferase family 39 protein [Planctomycetes bacterium]|nr:glycosyltransferase family 39 protein [Planctomycetota bacterium]
MDPAPNRVLSDWLRNGRPLRPATLILAAVLALALLISTFFYSGYFASDDASYLYGIKAVCGESRLVPSNLGGVRLGVTAPAALVYRFAHASIFATIASFLIYPPLMALVAYWMGRRIHSVTTGLVAAFLVATCPIVYCFAGAILPDNPMSFWAGLSLLAATGAIIAGHREDPRPAREAVGFLAAGLLLGLAYMAKETALILVVPLALAGILAGPRFSIGRLGSLAVLFVMGFAAALLLEAVCLRQIAGVWFWRLATSQDAAVMTAFRAKAEQQGWQVSARLGALASELRPLLGAPSVWLLAALPLYPILTRAGEGRRKAALVLLATFIWTFLYLTFGSASFKRYQPPTIQARYYALCVVPFAVMVAQVLTWATERLARLRRPRILWTAVAALLTLGGPALWAGHLFLQNRERSGLIFRSQETKAFLLALQDLRSHYPDRPIVISQYLTLSMRPILGHAGNVDPSLWLAPLGTEHRDGKLPAEEFILLASANPNRPDSLLASIEQAATRNELTLRPAGLGVYAAPLGKTAELKFYLYPLLSAAPPPNVRLGTWWAMKACFVQRKDIATRPATGG